MTSPPGSAQLSQVRPRPEAHRAGPDSRLALITADAVLSGVHDHPVRFAARLAATQVRGAGMAALHTQKALRAGVAWWRAAASNSAGAAAAARSTVLGLLWSRDPARAAYEAALSATVTHGHPAAIAGAASFAAAISLAAGGEGPLGDQWLARRTGSMSGLQSDVVEGFNGFVAEQREKPGECALTLVQFDSNDPYEVIHDAVPIAKVCDLTPQQYRPRGATPLLDALGSLVEAADARLAGMGHDEDQIVAVFTDGLENASRQWTRADLFDANTARKKDGWKFVFMGANQDSYAEAGWLGLDDGSVQDFRGDGEGGAYGVCEYGAGCGGVPGGRA